MKPSDSRLRRGAVGGWSPAPTPAAWSQEAGRAQGAGHTAHVSQLLHRPPHQPDATSKLRTPHSERGISEART